MTPVERVRRSYARIREIGEAPIWISLFPEERALARAASVDPALPLAGLTFAVKDNIDLAGLPTTAGCAEFAYLPAQSATIVSRLEAAGAIPLGKTNLDQFATGLVGVRSPYGICRSACNPEYIAGGSSSGSAVAVASGMVDFALGTDTAGSGRVPAAFNDIIGLKPTRGVFSMAGVVPACRSLDCPSLFTRGLALAKRLFSAAAACDSGDWSSREFTPLPPLHGRFRFGVPGEGQLEFFGDSESAALYRNAVQRCLQAGGVQVSVDFDPFRRAAALLYAGPWVAERYAAIQEFIERLPEALHPVTRQIIGGAARFTAADVFKAVYELGRLRQLAEREMAEVDCLLLPTTGAIYKVEDVLADPIQLNTNLGYYTNFVNLLDLSALAIPAGFRANGTPFGVTLIGPAMADLRLLEIASSLETLPLAVVGAHLTGQPLNGQLTERGATLRATTRTSPHYRLYALAQTVPAKPGLAHDPAFQGPGIEVEVWDMPLSQLGSFLAQIPPPLGLGTLTLETGQQVKGFICEPAALAAATEITHHGGWRDYLRQRSL